MIEAPAGWPFGTPGKSRCSSGSNARARSVTAPPRSPTRMMPSHRHMTPVRPRETSKPVFAMSKVEATMAAHTPGSPRTSQRKSPARKATKKKPAQIQLSI